MSDKTIVFNGSISQNYDDYLGPFLFEPYALDLAKRIEQLPAANVLELACGTGRLTRHLRTHLPASAQLTATDLNADMLAVAKEKVPADNITWTTVDMQNIAYADNQFDLVVSQFGVMLVPDRIKALSEIYRVLQKGGTLIYSVWGNIEENEIWNIGSKIVASLLGIDPIMQDPGPFSMQDEKAVLQLMEKVGFTNNIATIVKKTGIIEEAAMAAKGFVQGLPLYNIIKQKDPALVQKIQDALQAELISKLGDHPMRSQLNTLVVEAKK